MTVASSVLNSSINRYKTSCDFDLVKYNHKYSANSDNTRVIIKQFLDQHAHNKKKQIYTQTRTVCALLHSDAFESSVGTAGDARCVCALE